MKFFQTSDKTPPVYYPDLLALTPLYFLFAHNLFELSFLEQATVLRLGLPSLLIFLCSRGMLWLNRRFLGTTAKAGLFTLLLWMLVFGYGYFYTILVEYYGVYTLFSIKTMTFGYNKMYLIGCLLFIGAAYWWVKTTARDFQRTTRFLNRFAWILLALSCGQIVLYEGQRMLRNKEKSEASAFLPQALANSSSSLLPDIYYIILDSYASNSVLRDEFGFENNEFLAYLRQKGFYVADASRSNYPCTVLSLASSLNFDYLDALTTLVGTTTNDLSVAMGLIEENAVMRFLKKNGYTLVHFKTIFAPTARNRYADWEVDCGRGLIQDRFLKLFLKMTIFDPIVRRFSGTKREEIECQFSTLAEFPQKTGPRFIFAHIIAPHEPFVFLADGREVERAQQELYQGNKQFEPEGRRLYIQQLQYINHRMQELIETILSDSQRPPIILLQADHGARVPMEHALKPKWFSILNAYYFPDGTPAELYPTMSPVNTFRVIFNRYFQTSYALLPDVSYYSDINRTPYKFVVVPSE